MTPHTTKNNQEGLTEGKILEVGVQDEQNCAEKGRTFQEVRKALPLLLQELRRRRSSDIGCSVRLGMEPW